MTETIVANATTEIPTRTLVMGMAHADGTVQADEVYPVAEACGLSRDQVRSCLRRLVAEGLFDRDGEGREARYAATPAGRRLLHATEDRLRRAYRQDASGKGWDRRWHLAAFAVSERQRAARDTFRDRLQELGGAAVQNGLYVSPHAWEDSLRAEAASLGIVGNIALSMTDDLEIGGVRDPRELAQVLWPLDDLARRYERFIEVYHEVPESLERMRRDHERLTEADFLPGALLIGTKFNECFERDPLLPPELLPRPWPGRDARDLLRRSRRLGVLIREDHGKPRLFSMFDDVT